jgi:ATP-dependent Clp protease ATP-binding subunit ClpB
MQLPNKNIGIRLAQLDSTSASLMKTERIHADAELAASYPRLGTEQVVSGFSHFFARFLGVIFALCLLTLGSAIAGPEDDKDGPDYRLDNHQIELQEALKDAERLCRNKGIKEIRPVHLFVAMSLIAVKYEGKMTDTIFKDLSLSNSGGLMLREKLVESAIPKEGRELPADVEVKFSPELKELFKGAERERFLREKHTSGGSTVTPGHILLAMTQDSQTEMGKFMKDMVLDRHKVLKASRFEETDTDASQDPKTKSVLAEYTIDYSQRARENKFDPVIGRDLEIGRIKRILAQRRQNSPLLVGSAGVGKTALIEELAKQMPDADILELKLSFLTAGSKYRGDLEIRVKALIKEVAERNALAAQGKGRRVILFIDEIHLLNTDDYAGVAQHFKPALARGELPCIGATTLEEVPILEKDAPLNDRFERAYVEEPDREQSFEIMQKIAPVYEAFHKVGITEEAILATVDLTEQYIHDQQRPRVSIKAMDNAMASARLSRDLLEANDGSTPDELKNLRSRVATLENFRNLFHRRVARGNVSAQVELDATIEKLTEARRKLDVMEEFWSKGLDAWTQLQKLNKTPAITEAEKQAQAAKREELQKEIRAIHSQFAVFPLEVDEIDISRSVMLMGNLTSIGGMLESKEERMEKMHARIDERFVGQPEAAQAIKNASTALIRGKAGIGRPAETQFYFGAKGSGKSLAPEIIEQIGIVRNGFMIEVDLAEYTEKESINKLVGSPPGFQGDGPGLLTEFVRQKPRSVVYFKNADLASPEVLAMVQSIIKEGKLGDMKTKKNISFEGTVVIVSTSEGSDIAMDPNLTPEQRKEAILERLSRGVSRPRGTFRINSSDFDKAVYFDTLSEADLKEIFSRTVKALSDEEQGQDRFRVTLTEAAQKKFAQVISEYGVNSAENANFVRQLVRRNIEEAKTQLLQLYPRDNHGHLVIDYKESDDTLHFGTPETVNDAEKKSPIIIPSQGEEVAEKDPCARGFGLLSGGRKFQTPKATKHQAKTGEPEMPQGLADMAKQLERMQGQRQGVGEQPTGSSIIQAPAGSRVGPDGTLLGADGKPLQL